MVGLRAITLATGAALTSLLVVVVAGCRFDADYDGSRYRCGEVAGGCPPGFACLDGYCEVPADGAPPPSDAPPDGPPADAPPGDGGLDLCELAADAPPADTCAEGEARDLTAAARAPGGTTIYGDTSSYENHLGSPTSGCLSIVSAGADAIYSVNAEAGERLVARLVTAGWDSNLYLTNLCASGASCLAGADNPFDEGAGQDPEEIIHTFGSAGRYFLLVDSVRIPTQPASTGCFELQVRLEDP